MHLTRRESLSNSIRTGVRAASTPWSRGLLAGQRAMALALLGTFLACFALRWVYPLEPIAEWIMASFPANWSAVLLSRLGIFAKPFALWGGVATALIWAALLGAIWPQPGGLRRAQWPRALLALALLALSVWTLLGPRTWPGVTLLLVLFLLPWLGWPLLRQRLRAKGNEAPPDLSRRALLREGGLVFAGVLLASWLSLADSVGRALVSAGRAGGRLFAWAAPAARQPGFDVEGLPAEVTPVPEFYVMSKNVTDPDLSAAGWALRVDGLVRQPISLSLDELLTRPRRDQYCTLRCISNPVGGPMMSTALFTGVPLGTLLAEAQVGPNARRVVFYAPDEHSDSLPIELARQEDVLIALGMNGEYLTRAHGFPARLLVPGIYGFKSVKWLQRIELIGGDYQGHWQRRGWTLDASVHTVARIDVARREDGRLLVAGVAYTGRRGVSAVELRANGGPWQPADLHAPPLSGLTWVQWRGWLNPAGPGSLRIEARAFDAAGQPQDEPARDPFPDGASGLHAVQLEW